MRILSLGWGVQSWTLAAMSALGELPFVDVAIHSDTTHEREETYAFAQQWTPWLEERGVRVVTVTDDRATNIMKLSEASGNHYTLIPAYTARNYREDTEDILNEDDEIIGFLKVELEPAQARRFGANGQLRRQCTSRWKIEPLQKWLRAELAEQGETNVEQWLGISFDEFHRAKDSHVPWITNRFPLLEKRMDRADCLAWLKAHGLPSPGKSACTFCPYHSPKAWQQMKREGGPDWNNAVAADAQLRIDGRQWFVHPKRLPLEQAVVIPEDTGYSQLEMLASDDNDAECDSGHCFL